MSWERILPLKILPKFQNLEIFCDFFGQTLCYQFQTCDKSPPTSHLYNTFAKLLKFIGNRFVYSNKQCELAARTKWTDEFEKEPVEVQNFRKITDRFGGIHGTYSNLMKKPRKMSSWSRSDLETLGVVTPLSSHSRRMENGDVARSSWMAEGPFSENGENFLRKVLLFFTWGYFFHPESTLQKVHDGWDNGLQIRACE